MYKDNGIKLCRNSYRPKKIKDYAERVDVISLQYLVDILQKQSLL